MTTSDEDIKLVHSKDVYKKILKDEYDTPPSEFKWTNATIKLLLQIRLAMEDEFNNPTTKKRKLWEQITNEINKATGLTLSSDTCDSKYRNLLGTYRVNKRKENEIGKDAIKWEFFDQIDQVLDQKISKRSSRSTVRNTADASDILFQLAVDSDTDTNAYEENSGVKKEHKEKDNKSKEISLEKYLYLKLKRDKEKEIDRLIREEETWKERKELKLKEIEAINNLAAAIRAGFSKT